MIHLVSPRFDEFEHALRGVDGRYLLHSRSCMDWSLHILELGLATAMFGRNGASSIFQGALSGQFTLLLGLSPMGSGMVNGKLVDRGHVAWLPPGYEFYARGPAGAHWLSVSIDQAEVRRWVDDHGIGLDPRLLGFHCGWIDSGATSRLRSLLERASHPATEPGRRPGSRGNASLRAQVLEFSLAVLHSMQPVTRPGRGRPRADGREIVRHALYLAEERLDQTLRVEDFCRAIGVSGTTLQKAFHEQLGTSLHRYLTLKRLHAIHAMLREAESADTVSSLCSRFGIWDFGRFAARYRQIFGHLPSQAARHYH